MFKQIIKIVACCCNWIYNEVGWGSQFERRLRQWDWQRPTFLRKLNGAVRFLELYSKTGKKYYKETIPMNFMENSYWSFSLLMGPTDWQLICFARDKSSAQLFTPFQPMWQKKWWEVLEWQNTTQHKTDCRCSNNCSLTNHKHKTKTGRKLEYRMNIKKPYLLCRLSSEDRYILENTALTCQKTRVINVMNVIALLIRSSQTFRELYFIQSIKKSGGLKVQRLRAACNENLMISLHQISHVGIQLSFYPASFSQPGFFEDAWFLSQCSWHFTLSRAIKLPSWVLISFG